MCLFGNEEDLNRKITKMEKTFTMVIFLIILISTIIVYDNPLWIIFLEFLIPTIIVLPDYIHIIKEWFS